MKESKVTNAHFASNNKEFKKACKEAGVKPTSRQASKFRRGMGKAYQQMERKDVVTI